MDVEIFFCVWRASALSLARNPRNGPPRPIPLLIAHVLYFLYSYWKANQKRNYALIEFRGLMFQ
jgi:hypothetical protein